MQKTGDKQKKIIFDGMSMSKMKAILFKFVRDILFFEIDEHSYRKYIEMKIRLRKNHQKYEVK